MRTQTKERSQEASAAGAQRLADAPPTPEIAERLVEAVASRDYKAMYGVLAPNVRFRYLVPSGPGELRGAADVAAKYFDWFGSARVLEVLSHSAETVSDRTAVRYRFLVDRNRGWEVVEQQTFVDTDERGRIAALDLLCSGFRPAQGKGGEMPATNRAIP